MTDTTLIPPEEDKTPRSYATEPAQNVEYATLPPDITFKPDAIILKRPLFVVSVLMMVLIGSVTFWMPFFNGLLGRRVRRLPRGADEARAGCGRGVPR